MYLSQIVIQDTHKAKHLNFDSARFNSNPLKETNKKINQKQRF